MGRMLVERLTRPDCQVNIAVEREVQDTAVGNSAGARGEYRATGIAVTADVTRISRDDVLMVYDQYVGADMPSDADLELLVRSVETRLTAGRWYSGGYRGAAGCAATGVGGRFDRRLRGRPDRGRADRRGAGQREQRRVLLAGGPRLPGAKVRDHGRRQRRGCGRQRV